MTLVGVKVLVDVVCDGLNSGVVGLATVCIELLAYDEGSDLSECVDKVVIGGSRWSYF